MVVDYVMMPMSSHKCSKGFVKLNSVATTIFNVTIEPRFVELRATRQELSRAFDTFLSNGRDCASAATPAAVSDVEFVFESDLDEKRDDTDLESNFRLEFE